MHHSKLGRSTSGMGLGRVKTPEPAARVEASLRIAHHEGQIILRTYGSTPCWRIVFSTFRRCMSFHTARVKLGRSTSSSRCPDYPPLADLRSASPEVSEVPKAGIAVVGACVRADMIFGKYKVSRRPSVRTNLGISRAGVGLQTDAQPFLTMSFLELGENSVHYRGQSTCQAPLRARAYVPRRWMCAAQLLRADH